VIPASFVDIEDDDAVIDLARHGELQPVVVNDVLELGDEPYLIKLGRVPYEYQRDDEAERNPNDVLLQASSPVGISGPGSHALRKNSILTPASSITSWSFRAWA
jgi:hypothetical protein